ncbi:hypothetical protein ABZ807_09440 [Micromonospora sp. NPDC047548]|uniref:hypothetical protein n=1 Tax=Micromonospora sp. NPDC047548 TaxID=3155624 RepID=UPI003405BD2B
MAAAVVRDTVGAKGKTAEMVNELRFEVMWNGVLVAQCSTLAQANAVAALHPA